MMIRVLVCLFKYFAASKSLGHRSGKLSKLFQSLDDKVDLEVLEPITNVDGTKSVRVELVEEVVARPGQRAHHHRLLSLVLLQSPRAAGLVFRGRLKESLVEGCSGEVQVSALLLILHVSEVEVVLEAGALGFVKAAEGFVPAHLVLGGHLE